MRMALSNTPAIFFEPEGYILSQVKVMGRQAAGDAFFRAAMNAAGVETVLGCYTPSQSSFGTFQTIVGATRSDLDTRWCLPSDFKSISEFGGIYFPGPVIGPLASLRLHAGPAAYALTGITHTTASHRAMDAISSLLTSPVMPWDAVICTSKAVVETMQVVLSAQADMLRWRFGRDLDFTLPLTPVIPLGVHVDEFASTKDAKASARKSLGIEEEAIAFLFAGRLSFHAKAHPHAMYTALDRVAQETGRKLVLIQSGWFASDHIERVFRQSAGKYAPNVTHIFTDGRDGAAKANSWAASDVFVSLSDNIQETFGLTPIEAMAAGLPAVVTDWNGYKDTVRDGVDGYRIPTTAPAAGFGTALALRHEAAIDNYDLYCGLSCQFVAVDHDLLAERLKTLVLEKDIRLKMGASGQARAREVYSWDVVFKQYQALWDHQKRLRGEAQKSAAWQAKLTATPKQAPNRLDPFLSFEGYPSKAFTGDTRMSLRSGASVDLYQRLTADPLFSYASPVLPSPDTVDVVLQQIGLREDLSLAEISRLSGLPLKIVIQIAAICSKMGLTRAY